MQGNIIHVFGNRIRDVLDQGALSRGRHFGLGGSIPFAPLPESAACTASVLDSVVVQMVLASTAVKTYAITACLMR